MRTEHITDHQRSEAPLSPAADRSFEHRRQMRSLLAMIRAIVHRTAPTAASTDDYVAHLGAG